MDVTTNDKGIRILTASDGKFLTNGTSYGKVIRLGKNDSPENWHEVDAVPEPEELPDPMTKTEEKAMAYDVLMGVTE